MELVIRATRIKAVVVAPALVVVAVAFVSCNKSCIVHTARVVALPPRLRSFRLLVASMLNALACARLSPGLAHFHTRSYLVLYILCARLWYCNGGSGCHVRCVAWCPCYLSGVDREVVHSINHKQQMLRHGVQEEEGGRGAERERESGMCMRMRMPACVCACRLGRGNEL